MKLKIWLMKMWLDIATKPWTFLQGFESGWEKAGGKKLIDEDYCIYRKFCICTKLRNMLPECEEDPLYRYRKALMLKQKLDGKCFGYGIHLTLYARKFYDIRKYM